VVKENEQMEGVKKQQNVVERKRMVNLHFA
jgi:hypothetical protein